MKKLPTNKAKKSKNIQKKAYFILFLLLTATSALLIYRIKHNSVDWWKFASDGEIYHKMLFDKNKIYFGNNQGAFYKMDVKSGRIEWKFKTDHEIASSPLMYKSSIFITSKNGIIYALNKNSGSEMWRFENPKFYSFAQPYISGNLIYTSDLNGTLFALDINNGNLLWNYHSKPKKQPLLNINNNYYYLLSYPYLAENNYIFFAGTDGYLYSLDKFTGKLVWWFNSEGKIHTQPQTVGNKVIFSTNFGDTFALNKDSGKLIWKSKKEKSSTNCINTYEFSEIVNFPAISHPKRFLRLLWLFFKEKSTSFVVNVSDKGKVALINADSGKTVWETHDIDKHTACPAYMNGKLYFGSENYQFSLNFVNGKFFWKKEDIGKYFSTPEIIRSLISPFTDISVYNSILIANNSSGEISRIDQYGNTKWMFKIDSKVNSSVIKSGNLLFFSGTNGNIYSIKENSGAPPVVKSNAEISQLIYKVGSNDIFEINISFNENSYNNPWKDVVVSADFTHQSGKKIAVDGFYYDKNIWKVRFNPPLKGSWNWSINLKAPGNDQSFSGSFKSKTDTKNSYLKIYEKNHKRFTLDNKTIFNGVGIGNTIADYNRNGSPLDDWFADDYVSSGSTPSADAVNNYYTGNSLSLDRYLSVYDDQGKFNLYRWSVNNSSFNLWKNFTLDNRFLVSEGKYGDELVTALKKHDFQIWMTIFGFEVPFGTQYANELTAMKQYVRYVIARYGAFISVWEIANEAYVPESLVKFIADEIIYSDWENRPISISHIMPDMKEISVIAPHWYENEFLGDSDKSLVQEINKYTDYDKPVVFAEQGDKRPDYQFNSRDRMRVRAWTAFFNEAILIFWNQSDRKPYPGSVNYEIYHNSNLYIGEKERKEIASLQNFTVGLGLSAKKIKFGISNTSVRNYGLQSDNEIWGYFYHFENQNQKTSFNIYLDITHASVLSWYDPRSGDILNKFTVLPGHQSINSPGFSQDIALKIVQIK